MPVYVHSGTPYWNDRGVSGNSRVQKECTENRLGTPDSALFQGFTRRNGSRSEPMGSGVTETVHGREGAILDKKGIRVSLNGVISPLRVVLNLNR